MEAEQQAGSGSGKHLELLRKATLELVEYIHQLNDAYRQRRSEIHSKGLIQPKFSIFES